MRYPLKSFAALNHLVTLSLYKCNLLHYKLGLLTSSSWLSTESFALSLPLSIQHTIWMLNTTEEWLAPPPPNSL